MIDHTQQASGWWRVEKAADGTYRADYHYGNDRRSIYGFPTLEAANLETWETSPADYARG